MLILLGFIFAVMMLLLRLHTLDRLLLEQIHRFCECKGVQLVVACRRKSLFHPFFGVFANIDKEVCRGDFYDICGVRLIAVEVLLAVKEQGQPLVSAENVFGEIILRECRADYAQALGAYRLNAA